MNEHDAVKFVIEDWRRGRSEAPPVELGQAKAGYSRVCAEVSPYFGLVYNARVHAYYPDWPQLQELS